MNKLKLLALATVFALSVPAAHAQSCTTGTDGGLQLNWTAPPATSGITVTGYTVTITPPVCSATTPITLTQCTGSTTTNCIASNATTVTWRPGGPLYYGSWQVSVVANGTNSFSGAALNPSAPATATVLYAPSVSITPTPGGVTVTPVQ